ncbi:MAG: hypothetical protein IKX62_03790, partial [Bacteroidales bacterium]|nr:hypothetical protein [Bacteroidales bacterium]
NSSFAADCALAVRRPEHGGPAQSGGVRESGKARLLPKQIAKDLPEGSGKRFQLPEPSGKSGVIVFGILQNNRYLRV